MSQILEVSDSSVKKILRKLVVKDLISSNASKDGDFQLKQSIKKITLLDLLNTIENDKLFDYSISHLAQRISPNKEHSVKSEKLVVKTIQNGEDAFSKELDKVFLSDLLKVEVIQNGAIDWNVRINA